MQIISGTPSLYVIAVAIDAVQLLLAWLPAMWGGDGRGVSGHGA
jgi:hypothetical protein